MWKRAYNVENGIKSASQSSNLGSQNMFQITFSKLNEYFGVILNWIIFKHYSIVEWIIQIYRPELIHLAGELHCSDICICCSCTAKHKIYPCREDSQNRANCNPCPFLESWSGASLCLHRPVTLLLTAGRQRRRRQWLDFKLSSL